ncbi:MAG TPA: hypothetical protein VNG12_23445, partial [Acidimicrobiales bacterium]|nr:hypothetical protein [Acidimicrobiales bacterium]
MDETRWAAGTRAHQIVRRPEPSRRDRRYLVISVDDHFVEPPGLFVDRVPGVLRDSVPRVVSEEQMDYWLVDGDKRPYVGGDSVVG